MWRRGLAGGSLAIGLPSLCRGMDSEERVRTLRGWSWEYRRETLSGKALETEVEGTSKSSPFCFSLSQKEGITSPNIFCCKIPNS